MAYFINIDGITKQTIIIFQSSLGATFIFYFKNVVLTGLFFLSI
jgi:hypothetical protein